MNEICVSVILYICHYALANYALADNAYIIYVIMHGHFSQPSSSSN
jgi:hypothetical protein